MHRSAQILSLKDISNLSIYRYPVAGIDDPDSPLYGACFREYKHPHRLFAQAIDFQRGIILCTVCNTNFHKFTYFNPADPSTMTNKAFNLCSSCTARMNDEFGITRRNIAKILDTHKHGQSKANLLARIEEDGGFLTWRVIQYAYENILSTLCRICGTRIRFTSSWRRDYCQSCASKTPGFNPKFKNLALTSCSKHGFFFTHNRNLNKTSHTYCPSCIEEMRITNCEICLKDFRSCATTGNLLSGKYCKVCPSCIQDLIDNKAPGYEKISNDKSSNSQAIIPKFCPSCKTWIIITNNFEKCPNCNSCIRNIKIYCKICGMDKISNSPGNICSDCRSQYTVSVDGVEKVIAPSKSVISLNKARDIPGSEIIDTDGMNCEKDANSCRIITIPLGEISSEIDLVSLGLNKLFKAMNVVSGNKECTICHRGFKPSRSSITICGRCAKIHTCPCCKRDFITPYSSKFCSLACANFFRYYIPNDALISDIKEEDVHNIITSSDYSITLKDGINDENVGGFVFPGAWAKIDSSTGEVIDLMATKDISNEYRQIKTKLRNPPNKKYAIMSNMDISFRLIQNCSYKDAVIVELLAAQKWNPRFWSPNPQQSAYLAKHGSIV